MATDQHEQHELNTRGYPSHSAVWDLIRQGEAAALATSAPVRRDLVVAAGEWRAGRIVLARIVPPLFSTDPQVFPVVRELAEALLTADDDPFLPVRVADRLRHTVMLTPARFVRPNAMLLKEWIAAGQAVPDGRRRLVELRMVATLFTGRADLPGHVHEWTPQRHVEVANALRDAVYPVDPLPVITGD